VPLAPAAICGLLAPVTFVAGFVLGDLAQPDGFSPANDNISDIGAQTADERASSSAASATARRYALRA
jgi:hypothetical protein